MAEDGDKGQGDVLFHHDLHDSRLYPIYWCYLENVLPKEGRIERKEHLTTRSLWFHWQWEHFVPIVYFCKKCDSFLCDCYWKSRNQYLIFLVCWSWDMEHLSNFDDFILSCSFTVHYKHRNYWFYHLNSQNVVVRYMVSVFNSHENSESVSWSVLG